MNYKQRYNLACKEYEKARLYKRKSTDVKHLKIAENLAKECLTENPQDNKCWYLLGLIWYCFPSDYQADYQERSVNCETALKKAIELKPDDDWSNMYLGHLYFDEKKFEIALHQFEKVSSEYFDGLDLHWRVLKLEELILCCKLYLDFDRIEDVKIEKYAEKCEKTDESKYVFPLEMMRCVLELSEKPEVDKSKLKRLFLRLKKMLKKSDNEDVFVKEILKIESNL
jgi:tetratricopeptide (TPR) repeat protein